MNRPRLPHPFDTIPFHRLSYPHPSPVHKLPGLTQRTSHLNKSNDSNGTTITLWTKREDQAGPLICYGNKYRKFEYIIPDILSHRQSHKHQQDSTHDDHQTVPPAQAVTTLVTEGALQSNHTVQVASLAQFLNLKCTVLLHRGIGGLRASSNKHAFETVGNVQLNRILGANVMITDEADTGDQHGPLIPVLDQLREQGEVPYWISSGASLHPLGGLGYARCAFEIAEQEGEMLGSGQLGGTGRFDFVFVACGSGSTLAGLIAGFKLLEKTRGSGKSSSASASASNAQEPVSVPRVIGIMTSPTKSLAYQQDRILRLARATGQLIGLDAENDITESDVVLDDGFVGEAYGILDKDTAKTIDLVARTDSLLLDPVYTGKVMRGMLQWAASGQLQSTSRADDDGKKESINALFIHTGGQNALNAYADVWPSGSKNSD